MDEDILFSIGIENLRKLGLNVLNVFWDDFIKALSNCDRQLLRQIIYRCSKKKDLLLAYACLYGSLELVQILCMEVHSVYDLKNLTDCCSKRSDDNPEILAYILDRFQINDSRCDDFIIFYCFAHDNSNILKYFINRLSKGSYLCDLMNQNLIYLTFNLSCNCWEFLCQQGLILLIVPNQLLWSLINTVLNMSCIGDKIKKKRQFMKITKKYAKRRLLLGIDDIIEKWDSKKLIQ
jgi:hypothetical protein